MTQLTAEQLTAGWLPHGWIVGDGHGVRWRTWHEGNPCWTFDRKAATRYARREDAEAVHAEDEDVWLVVPYCSTPDPIAAPSNPDRLVEAMEELEKIAEQVGEVGDPFAAWEAIDAIIRERDVYRTAIQEVISCPSGSRAVAIAHEANSRARAALIAAGTELAKRKDQAS